MELTEQETKQINALLDKALEIVEGNIKKPSKRRQDTALDVPLHSTAIIQKLLLQRFGTKEELLVLSMKSIMQTTVNYYNAIHAERLGFMAKLKKKFFE
jgi:hypothetical protein